MMVGRGVLLRVDKAESKIGNEALRVAHIKCKNDEGILVVDDVSFCLNYGEVVGIAGVQGNGQTELVEVISGMTSDYQGEIWMRIMR